MMKFEELRYLLDENTSLYLIDHETEHEIGCFIGRDSIPTDEYDELGVARIRATGDSLFVYCDMPRWSVEVTISGRVHISVRAANEDEAMGMVEDMTDVYVTSDGVRIGTDAEEFDVGEAWVESVDDAELID